MGERRGMRVLAAAVVAAMAVSTVVVAQPAAATAPPVQLTLYAGTGATGAAVPGPATSTPVWYPWGVGRDARGNVYIADYRNNRVEKVTPDGELGFVAGDGTNTPPTPGAAAGAPLGRPSALAADAAGNLFVGLQGRIVKITTDGVLSFVAGTGVPGQPTNGEATSSQVNRATAMAVGADGTLYVADTDSHQVYKVTTDDTLTIIAGTGVDGPAVPGTATASTLRPVSVATDSSGNVFIGVLVDPSVVMVDPAGALTRVAGTGVSGATTDGTADTRKFREPEGLAVDQSGAVYVSDDINCQISKFAVGGMLTVVAGTGTCAAPTPGVAPLSSPLAGGEALLVTADGVIYYSDSTSNTIDRIGPPYPNAPTAFTVTGGDHSASVRFTPPTDHGASVITSYEASTDNGATWAAVATTAGSNGTRSATLAGLANGTAHQVMIRAANAVGPGTATAAATVVPAGPPDAPTGVVVTGRNHSASVRFAPPASNGGSAIIRYDASTDGGSTWTAVTTTAGPAGTRTALITGLSNGVTYQVELRAANAAGPGAATPAASVVPALSPPAAPTGITATPSNGAAAVVFTPPADDGGSPLTGYQTSTDGGTTWLPLTTTAATAGARTGTVPGLTNGTGYTLRLRAVNAVGPGDAGTAAPVTPGATVPATPTALTVQPLDASARLTFAPPADDGGSPITGYQVALGGVDTWTAIGTAAGPDGTRTATLTGLTDGTPATLRLRAVNAVGASHPTPAATVTPLAPPPTPTGITVTAGTSAITVAWQPVTSGGAPVTSYTATAHPGPATCTTTTTSCVLGAEAGVEYTVTVVAGSASGPSQAAGPSGTVVAAAPAASPAPPATQLTLTTDRGKITTAVPGQQIVVIGTGFAAHSTATITIYSTPLELGTVVTDGDGNFTKPVSVPDGLANGSHEIVALGAAPDGTPRAMKLDVLVARPAGRGLPVTGADIAHLQAVGLLALCVGVALVRFGRRRYSRLY